MFLDKGTHVSILSIFDPQMSSSASELDLFCASSRVLSNADAFLLRTFGLQRSCASRTGLRYLHCSRVFRMPHRTFDEFYSAENSRSFIHRLLDDAQIKTFHLVTTGPFLISLPGCARPGFITLIPKCDRRLVDADNGHLPTSGLENSLFATAKRTTLRGNLIFCHHSS